MRNDRGSVIQNFTRHESLGPKGQIVVRWFSYKTLIAFKVDGQPRVISQNYWTRTTGKHLNELDGGDKVAKKARVTDTVFEQLFEEQLGAESTASASEGTTPPAYGSRNLCL